MRSRLNVPVYLSLLAAALVFSACKKDKPPVPEPVAADKLEIKVYPMYGSDSLYLDSTYHTSQGYDVQFTDIKFFAGSWKNGATVLTNANLFDYRETGKNFISAAMKPDGFSALQGYLGIGPDENHLDPTAFSNDNPLNIVNAGGMHWGWNPGYIFIKVEARVDTIPDGVALFDHYGVFHVGTDAFLQTLDFPAVSWQKMGDNYYRARMKLNMQQFLSNGAQSIDLKTEHITHSGAGQEALSQKAISNFKSALSFIN